MTGKRVKHTGREANSPLESWWSGRRLPIPKTPAHRPGANAYRKQPEKCVTDSCGELITFCPVSGWSPPGGVSSRFLINRASTRLESRRVIRLWPVSLVFIPLFLFNPCVTREKKHSGADYVPKYEQIRSIGSWNTRLHNMLGCFRSKDIFSKVKVNHSIIHHFLGPSYQKFLKMSLKFVLIFVILFTVSCSVELDS